MWYHALQSRCRPSAFCYCFVLSEQAQGWCLDPKRCCLLLWLTFPRSWWSWSPYRLKTVSQVPRASCTLLDFVRLSIALVTYASWRIVVSMYEYRIVDKYTWWGLYGWRLLSAFSTDMGKLSTRLYTNLPKSVHSTFSTYMLREQKPEIFFRRSSRPSLSISGCTGCLRL